MADANAAAGSVEEQDDRPVVLFCTVGGSPQPIATALGVCCAWKMVLFLVSDGERKLASAGRQHEDRVR